MEWIPFWLLAQAYIPCNTSWVSAFQFHDAPVYGNYVATELTNSQDVQPGYHLPKDLILSVRIKLKFKKKIKGNSNSYFTTL